MGEPATTRMSSKGQVVIPERVRKNLGLQAGDRFVVVGHGDVVILKTLAPPDLSRFDDLVRKARREAKQVGLTKRDIRQTIQRVRRKR